MELLVTTVSVAVIITGLHWTVAGQSVTTRDGDGLDAADDATNSVTCDFENGLCGWRNITQQAPNEDYGLKWKRGLRAATFGQYVFIDVGHVAAGNKGGLASPKLPQRPGYECELSFQYCFVGACALQVAVVVMHTGEVKEIKQYNRTGPQTTCRISEGSAIVNCSKSAYWVYFVGEVLSNDNSNCGDGAAIVVDNIEYNVKNRRTSPAPVASTPVPTVATTSTTTTNPATTADATLPPVSVRGATANPNRNNCDHDVYRNVSPVMHQHLKRNSTVNAASESSTRPKDVQGSDNHPYANTRSPAAALSNTAIHAGTGVTAASLSQPATYKNHCDSLAGDHDYLTPVAEPGGSQPATASNHCDSLAGDHDYLTLVTKHGLSQPARASNHSDSLAGHHDYITPVAEPGLSQRATDSNIYDSLVKVPEHYYQSLMTEPGVSADLTYEFVD